jgi:hypothetical protein
MVNSEVTCSSFFIHVAFVSCESQLLWFCDLCRLTTEMVSSMKRFVLWMFVRKLWNQPTRDLLYEYVFAKA